jgi:hypothetical protein
MDRVSREQVLYGDLPDPAEDEGGSLDDTAFVQQLYRNVLDREGEARGVEAWKGELQGGMSRADFPQLKSFCNSAVAPCHSAIPRNTL